MILLRLCQLGVWIGRHTTHMAARTWDVLGACIVAIIGVAIAALAWIALPRWEA